MCRQVSVSRLSLRVESTKCDESARAGKFFAAFAFCGHTQEIMTHAHTKPHNMSGRAANDTDSYEVCTHDNPRNPLTAP